MSKETSPHLQDVAILTRAVENVFRKLIRFLVGRISLVKLQEMIRIIYLQEAEKQLREEHPQKNTSLTKLAVLTGLDTRTLVKVRNSERFWKPLSSESRFLKSMTPENCVIDIWLNDDRFFDSKIAQPKKLDIYGEDNSFEVLVAEAVTARGVTFQSLLEKLVTNRAVVVDDDEKKIELLEMIYAPYKFGDAMKALEFGLTSTVVLLDTVFHNYEAISEGHQTHFQRLSWTYYLDERNLVKFEKVMRTFLKKADENARKKMLPFENKKAKNKQITAGVGMFFFEDKSSSISV